MVWCDNSSSVALAANPVLHARVKHVELVLHFMCDMVLNGKLQVNYVPGHDQVAGVLTKPLTASAFSIFRDQLNVTTLEEFQQGNAEGISEEMNNK